MDNHENERYKADVTSVAHNLTRVTARLLFFVAVSSACNASGPTIAMPDADAGDSAIGGFGAETAHGATGGSTSNVGGTSDGPSRPIAPAGTCLLHADCDDGDFCNGTEQCRAQGEGSDIKVCMVPDQGPCGENACDEESKQCDCSEPDRDQDGFSVPGCVTFGEQPDCDDTDRWRNPARQEECDLEAPTHDEDCNDQTFGGIEADLDKDTYVDARCLNYLTYQEIGTPANDRRKSYGQDCDDGRPQVHPGAPEVCDGFDNNCDRKVDDVLGAPTAEVNEFYPDADGDYWGDASDPLRTSCKIPPPGYTKVGGDCDDQNPSRSRARPEICNGIDDDCDELGLVDEPPVPGTLMLDEPYDGGLTKFECKGYDGWEVEICPRDRLDCDDEYLNGCETIGTTLCNCRACGNVCQFSCGEEGCEEIRAVNAGLHHTCFLVQPSPADGHGTVACTGRNADGQLGIGTTTDTDVPEPIPSIVDATAIATGSYHSCAVRADGRGYCWGRNDAGQLGLGPAGGDVISPAQVLPLNGLAMRQITAGSFHTCALYDEGAVECWGRGGGGQLGNDYYDDSGYPSAVVHLVNDDYYDPIIGAAQIAGGYAHTCVLVNGKVECWGSNDSMQLGEDPLVLPSVATATPVPGLEEVFVDQIAAGAVNTCARAGTKVYCWGGNAYHQLAYPDGSMGPPRQVALPNDIVGIAVGPFFACGLSHDGTIRCWGINEHGERGNLDSPPAVSPTLVPLDGAKSIFSGNGNQICAVKLDDSTWCWGQNNFGQLGNGSTSMHPQPVATRVSAWGSHQFCQ